MYIGHSHQRVGGVLHRRFVWIFAIVLSLENPSKCAFIIILVLYECMKRHVLTPAVIRKVSFRIVLSQSELYPWKTLRQPCVNSSQDINDLKSSCNPQRVFYEHTAGFP